MRRLLVVGAVAVGLFALLAAPARGHAALVRADPAADAMLDTRPGRVSLTFDEPVDSSLGGIRVFGPDGERVDAGPTELEADGLTAAVDIDAAEVGTYTVAWSAVSADGHAIDGSYVFHVEQRTGGGRIADTPQRTASQAIGGVGRWLGFAGALVAVGALVFVPLTLRRRKPPTLRRLRPVLFVASLAVMAGTIMALLGQVAILAGRTPWGATTLLLEAVFETRLGVLSAARVCAAVGFGLFAIGPWERFRLSWWPTMTAATAALVLPAFMGHAWTAPLPALAVVLDVLHLAATAVWVGGLVSLALVAPGSNDALGLAKRFSPVALGAATVTVITGLAQSWIEIGAVDALLTTAYGRWLLIKVGLVVILLGLGYLNRYRLLRVGEAAAAATRRVLRSVGFEVGVAAAVIAATAILVALQPARLTAAQPFSETVPEGTGQLNVVVEPAQPGVNEMHLYFLDAAGLPRDVDAVEVQVESPGIPSRRIPLETVTASHFLTFDLDLPTPRDWMLVITSVSGDDSRSTVEVEVPVR